MFQSLAGLLIRSGIGQGSGKKKPVGDGVYMTTSN
jgi:hypothetical protein